jgi:hypothetical protein
LTKKIPLPKELRHLLPKLEPEPVYLEYDEQQLRDELSRMRYALEIFKVYIPSTVWDVVEEKAGKLRVNYAELKYGREVH